MNTVKFDGAARSSSSEGPADGKTSKVIIVDVSDVLSHFEWADERLQENVLFEDVVSQAMNRRFNHVFKEFDEWLLTMRYLLAAYLQGDDLEDGISKLETIVDILADKLSSMRLYEAGRIRYRYLLKKDRLYLMSPAVYRSIVLSEVADAPF